MIEFFSKFVDSVFLCFESIICFYSPLIIVDNPFDQDRCGSVFLPCLPNNVLDHNSDQFNLLAQGVFNQFLGNNQVEFYRVIRLNHSRKRPVN